MAFETIQIEVSGELATLTLNRPAKRNALTPTMVAEITAALEQLERDAATRVVLLTGAGGAFCSGMDISVLESMSRQSPEQTLQETRAIARMFWTLYRFPKPVISVVRGAAVAGGCGLATLADFTLAEPAAKFGYPEGRIGFIPAIVSVFLVAQIGEKRARPLLLSGRIITADEACAAGLVSEVLPEDRLDRRARELASSLLSVSPASAAYMKRLLCDFNGETLQRQLEAAVQANVGIRSAPEFREGLTSFLEKRKPRWIPD